MSMSGLHAAPVTGCVTLLCMLFIASCAIQPGTRSEDQQDEDSGKRDEIIIVDSSVQQSFDNAISLMKQEQFKAAIPVLEQVVAQEQRLTAPYINLAIAYNRTGDNKKARENIDKALKIDRFDPVASNELGLMLRKEGKFDEARQAYERALQRNPEFLPVIRNLGILCDIYLRDWDCALEQFEKYQDLQPDDQVKIWIADLKRRNGG